MLPPVATFSEFIDDKLAQHGYAVLTGPFRVATPMWHWHRGVEIVFIHSGSAEILAKGWRGTLLPGQASIASAQVPHGASGNFSRTVIHIVPELVPDRDRALVDRILDSSTVLTLNLTSESARRLLWVGEELKQIPSHGRHRELAQALIGLAVTEVALALEQPSEPHQDLLSRIIAHMSENLRGEETLDALSDRFGCSRSYVSQLFRSRTGYSPGQYWLKLRLEHACRLLTGKASIEDIANAVGFQSARGFQRAFRRQYGIPPSKYRTQLGNHSR